MLICQFIFGIVQQVLVVLAPLLEALMVLLPDFSQVCAALPF